jgi:hypothetical protein
VTPRALIVEDGAMALIRCDFFAESIGTATTPYV